VGSFGQVELSARIAASRQYARAAIPEHRPSGAWLSLARFRDHAFRTVRGLTARACGSCLACGGRAHLDLLLFVVGGFVGSPDLAGACGALEP